MEVVVKITNKRLFGEKVLEIDVTGLKVESERIFSGGIYIHAKNGKTIPFYGIIYENDFEADFGFVLSSDKRNM